MTWEPQLMQGMGPSAALSSLIDFELAASRSSAGSVAPPRAAGFIQAARCCQEQ